MFPKLSLAIIIMVVSCTHLNAGQLSSALILNEERAGQTNRDLPNDRRLIKVDINSTIHIKISTAGLVICDTSGNQVNSERTNQAKRIEKLITGMNTWTNALVQGWKSAQALATTPKMAPEYNSLSRDVNKNYRAFSSGYQQYSNALKDLFGGPERKVMLESELNNALGLPPEQGLPKILELFSEEIVWLNKQIVTLSDDAIQNGNPIGIKMAASHVHKNQSTPIHIL